MLHKMLKSMAFGLAMITAGSAMAQIPADTLRVVEYVPASHAFGRQGQVLIGGSTSLDLAGVHRTQGGTKNIGPILSIAPQASVFVAPHFALGLTASLDAKRTSKNESTLKDASVAWGVKVGPLFTASVPMADRWTFLPSVAPVYGYESGSHRAAVDVQLNFAVHAADHLMLSFGPYVSQDVYSNNKNEGRDTTYGLKAGVLGWL